MRHFLSILFLVLVVTLNACQNQRATFENVGGSDNGDPFLPGPLVTDPLEITFEIAPVGSTAFQLTDLSLPAPGAIKLRWSYAGATPDSNSCKLEGTSGVLVTNAFSTKTYQSGNLSSDTSYTLSCTVSGVEYSRNLDISVANAAVSLGLSGKLTSQSIFQSVLTVYKGSHIDLSWTVEGNPSYCSLILVGTGTLVVDALAVKTKNAIPIPQTSRFDLVCPKVGVSPDPSVTLVVVAVDVPVTDAPAITLLEGTPYTFPDTVSGTQITRTLTFKNTGNINISALSLSSDLAPFSLVDISDCAGSLVPNDTCTFQMRYSPTAVGILSKGFVLSYRASVNGALTDKTFSFTLSGSGLAVPPPPLCFKFSISESTFVAANPGDPNVQAYSQTSNPHLRVQMRKKPTIRIDNLSSQAGAVLTQFRITMGDSRFYFSNLTGAFATTYPTQSDWDDIQGPSSGGGSLVVNFGAGLPATRWGLFSIVLEPYPITGFFPHPDYRTVLFDMNGINAWGGSVTPSAQISATFRLNGVDKVTQTVNLPNFTVNPPLYYNENLGPAGGDHYINTFTTQACVP